MKVLACILLITEGAVMDFQHEPRIYKDQGFLLNPAGLVALPTDNIQTSIMIKVSKPKLIKFSDKCVRTCTETDELEAFSTEKCIMRGKVPSGPPLEVIINDTIRSCFQNCIEDDRCVFLHKDNTGCKKYDNTALLNNIKETVVDINCTKELLKQQNCVMGHESRFSDSLTTSLENEIEVFWENAHVQLQELNVIEIHPGKKKRQAGLIIGIAGIATSLLTTGFNWYNNKKLESKINNLRSNFKDFVKETHSFEQSTFEVEREILKVIDSMQTKEKRIYEEMACKTNKIALSILQEREVKHFKSKVSTILKPLEYGKRTGTLTPNLLNVSTVQSILEHHPRFHKTLYQTNPTLIYATSKFTIAEIEQDINSDTISFHLILDTPILNSDQIFYHYKTIQTGFSYNNKCWKHKMPSSVYEKWITSNNTKRRAYFSLDNVHCSDDSNIFKFCDLNITSSESDPIKMMEDPCLSTEEQKCELYLDSCDEKVIYSVHGLLTRSHSEIKGIYKNITDQKKIKIWNPASSKTKTAYWSWKIYSYVELQKGVARASDFTGTVSIIDENAQLKWWNNLIKTDEHLEKANLTKAYKMLQRSIDEIDQQRDWFASHPESFSKDVVLATGITVALALLGAVSFYCCIKKHRETNQNKKVLKRKHDAKRYIVEKRDKDEVINEVSALMPEPVPSFVALNEEDDSTSSTSKRRKTEENTEMKGSTNYNPYVPSRRT